MPGEGHDSATPTAAATAARGPRPPRVPAEVPLRFGAAFQSGREAGAVMNVSAGGLFVHASTLFPVGTLLWVAFALPLRAGPRPLAAAASVRWVNHPSTPPAPALPPGMGLELHDLDSDARWALDAFVAEGLNAPSIPS